MAGLARQHQCASGGQGRNRRRARLALVNWLADGRRESGWRKFNQFFVCWRLRKAGQPMVGGGGAKNDGARALRRPGYLSRACAPIDCAPALVKRTLW